MIHLLSSEYNALLYFCVTVLLFISLLFCLLEVGLFPSFAIVNCITITLLFMFLGLLLVNFQEIQVLRYIIRVLLFKIMQVSSLVYLFNQFKYVHIIIFLKCSHLQVPMPYVCLYVLSICAQTLTLWFVHFGCELILVLLYTLCEIYCKSH